MSFLFRGGGGDHHRLPSNRYIIARSFFLVHHQNLLANQMNLRLIDSGIGNPNQVRDKYEKQRRRRSEILSDYCAVCCLWLVIAIRRCLEGERRHLTLFFIYIYIPPHVE